MGEHLNVSDAKSGIGLRYQDPEKSSIEKIGSEETTATNSKAKASTGDSFLRPPSPSSQKQKLMTKEISINVQLNKKEPGSLFGTKKSDLKEASNKPD